MGLVRFRGGDCHRTIVGHYSIPITLLIITKPSSVAFLEVSRLVLFGTCRLMTT